MLNGYQFDQRFRKLDPEPQQGLWSSSRRFKFFENIYIKKNLSTFPSFKETSLSLPNE
jgi:hypothetical protein